MGGLKVLHYLMPTHIVWPVLAVIIKHVTSMSFHNKHKTISTVVSSFISHNLVYHINL